jgi:glucose-1-phosphate adenylyltransferase
MKVDNSGRVLEFAEKPTGRGLKEMQVDTTIMGLSDQASSINRYIASMGIYAMKADKLKDLLFKHAPQANDFGSEVIPYANSMGCRVQAYLFDDYWEDIGTIDSFYHANIGMCGETPIFLFYD